MSDGHSEEPGFLIRPMVDILADQTEPDWIVEGILMRGAVTFLTGDSGTFKTFLAMDLANRLTDPTSKGWLTHIIDRQSRAMFEDEDEYEQMLANAAQQMGEYEFGQMVKRLQEDSEAFRVLYIMAESTASAGHRQEAWLQTTGLKTSPHFWLVTQSINLATDLEAVVDLWEEHQKDLIDVVIVDTFSANTPGVDENSKQSLSPSLAALRKLKERNKAVLVLHHKTKDGKAGYRGHSSIENDTDIRFTTEREGKGEIITLRSDRQKEFEDWNPYQVKVPVVTLYDDDGHPRLRRSGQPLTSRAIAGTYEAPTVNDEVLVLLQEMPEGGTAQEIADALGVEYATAAKRLKKLLEGGDIQRNASRQPYVYYVEGAESLEDL